MSDLSYRILILGDVGVGKSSLLGRFLDDKFSPEYQRTLFLDFEVRRVEVAGEMMLLAMWDACGKESYHNALRNFYREAHGVIIVYDVTSLASFRNVEHWLAEIGDFCQKDVNITLVGNKCDEEERREVTQEEASSYAERVGLSFCEASAKSGANVSASFETLALNVYCRLVLEPVRPSTSTPSQELEDGQDQEEKDHVEQDQLEQDHVEQDHVEQDHVEQDHVEQDHVEQDHVENDQPEKDQVENDQVEMDQPENDQPEKDQPEINWGEDQDAQVSDFE